MIGANKKNLQLLDIIEYVETCKQGLVLLVGGFTDEEQNNVGTSLTVRITIKLLKTLDFFKRFSPHLHFFSNFQ